MIFVVVVNDKGLHLIDYEYAIDLHNVLSWEYIMNLLAPLNIFRGFLQCLGISTFDVDSIFNRPDPTTTQLQCFLQLIDIYGASTIVAENKTHNEKMLKYIRSPPHLKVGQTFSEVFKLMHINPTSE